MTYRTPTDTNKFWDTVRKTNNSKAAHYAQLMAAQMLLALPLLRDGAVTLKIFIILLLTRTQKCRSPTHIFDTVRESQFRKDAVSACNRQKCVKAVGPDNIAMEAFINSTIKLHVHLSILFNLFITFGYLPMSFATSLIISLRINVAICQT